MSENLTPPAPEKSERRNTKLIIALIVAFLVLCVCCFTVVLAWNFGDAVIEALEGLSLQSLPRLAGAFG